VTTHALNLTSPGELIAAVPFILGFPRRAVVLIPLEPRRVGLIQRLDLPDPGQEAYAAETPATAAGPGRLGAAPRRYEDEPGHRRPMIDSHSSLLPKTRSGSSTGSSSTTAAGGPWTALIRYCCSPQGTKVPDPTDVSRIAAEFVAAGVAPLPARTDLQDSVQAHTSAAHVHAIIDRIDAAAKEIGTSGLSSDTVADSWARVLDPRRRHHSLPRRTPRSRWSASGRSKSATASSHC
jgi:hypothetical protein